jgi:hypothetical protein
MRKNLFEEMEDSPVSGMMADVEPPPDSIDDQIDALIIRYEKESIDAGEEKSEEERMMESLRQLSLGFLFEQDEEGAPADPGAPADAPTGSETPKSNPKPPEEKKPPIDVDLFTKKIARLVMNAHTLLQVEEVIIARAMEFLKKNYGNSYVEQMQDILDNQYDFNLDGDEDIIDVPIALGAGGKSAGG